MQDVAPLLKRTYIEINRNRRRLISTAYEVYPEFAYCDPEQFNWSAPEARANIFDLYYLYDSGYLDLVRSATEGHRRPDFFMLTPKGADLVEAPGKFDECFPLCRRQS
jgi:hypothetical protein